MRLYFSSILSVLLVLTGALLFARPALADESVEGHGFVVRIPDGFRKEMDSSTSERGASQFSPYTFGGFGGLGTQEMADMKVFLRGPRRQPEAAIVIMSGPMDEAKEGISTADLDEARSEARKVLGSDVDIQRTTVSGFEAAEIIFDLSAVPDAVDAGIEGTICMLAVPTGDFAVMVMYINMQPDQVLEAQGEWQIVKLGLRVDPPMTWDDVMFWGLIAGGGFFLLSFAWRAFRGAGGGDDIPASETTEWGFGDDPYDRSASSARRTTAVPEPKRASVRTSPGPGLRSTFERAGSTVSKPPPPPPGPESATSGGGTGGLRATLPPSGRWSDAHN